MSESEKQATLTLDVDITDKFVANQISYDNWEKEYAPVLFEKTGELIFRLYDSCPCKMRCTINIEVKGFSVNTDEGRCDMCLREKENINHKRMNAVLESVHKLIDSYISNNWDSFAEKVKEITGRDLTKDGVNGLSTIASSHELLHDAQILASMVDCLLAYVDITKLPPIKAGAVRGLIRAYKEIMAKAHMNTPNETIDEAYTMAEDMAEKLKESYERGLISSEEDFVNLIKKYINEQREDK
jgi:hypothetical protein